MSHYDYVMKQYPNHVVFLKQRNFYNLRRESAYVIHKLLGFRLYINKEELCTGCPVDRLGRLLEVLEEQQISYVVLDKEEIEFHKDFENNQYMKFTSIFEEMEMIRQQEILHIKEEQIDLFELETAIRVLSQSEYYKTVDEDTNGKVIGQKKKGKDGELVEAIHYAVKLLKKVYERGGLGKRNDRYKRPFSLPLEVAIKQVSEKDVKISEFVSALNEAKNDPEMRPLRVTSFTNWLTLKGYLTEEVDDQKKKYRTASKLGENIGITSVERQGAKGPYIVNLYSPKAQRFLLENMKLI